MREDVNGTASATSDAIIRAEQVVKTYDTGTTKVQALQGRRLRRRAAARWSP